MTPTRTVTIVKDDTRPWGIQILAEDGRDLATDLLIRKATWTLEAGQPPVVTLECLASRINARGRLEVVPVSTIADELDAQPRAGADTDAPEGARYVILSDTFARQLSAALRTPTP